MEVWVQCTSYYQIKKIKNNIALLEFTKEAIINER